MQICDTSEESKGPSAGIRSVIQRRMHARLGGEKYILRDKNKEKFMYNVCTFNNSSQAKVQGLVPGLPAAHEKRGKYLFWTEAELEAAYMTIELVCHEELNALPRARRKRIQLRGITSPI